MSIGRTQTLDRGNGEERSSLSERMSILWEVRDLGNLIIKPPLVRVLRELVKLIKKIVFTVKA